MKLADMLVAYILNEACTYACLCSMELAYMLDEAVTALDFTLTL
jgi:hypothetical protein